MKALLPLCGAFLVGLCTVASAADDDGLSEQIRQLKSEALDLNRDLTLLEQELLYASPQTSIFVSVDVGTPIRLVDVKLRELLFEVFDAHLTAAIPIEEPERQARRQHHAPYALARFLHRLALVWDAFFGEHLPEACR